MKSYTSSSFATGFAYPEGPRWHDGLLWFADQHEGIVYALVPDGSHAESFPVSGSPSGIGWLPNGDMLVIAMETHEVLRRTNGRLERHADLSHWHRAQSNEMVVVPDGRAYVGNIGFDFDNGEDPAPTMLLLVEADGTVRQVADDLMCPNGTVVTPDGKTLIIAESLANRLTAFDIAQDGSLWNRRVFAEVPGHVPDGICLDAEGQIWAASPFTNSVIRVAEGGEITATVAIEDAGAFACMLGGENRNTLFVCCAAEHQRSKTVALRSGRIDIAQVDVPGAGWP